MHIAQVLDEYRKGDADRRMGLFLYYRELRNDFNAVDQEDLPECRAVPETPAKIRHAFQKLFFMLHRRSCGLGS